MSSEEFRKRKSQIKGRMDNTINSLEEGQQEANRVATVAHNTREILDDLDQEFENQTGLNGKDIPFLFASTGLQVARWVILNELTKPEKAGQGNQKEDTLHKFQEKILQQFGADPEEEEGPYHASMEHIITKLGVPYDATAPLTKAQIDYLKGKSRMWDFDIESYIPTEKMNLFKGANHRYSTLGHDPVLGLIFGTGNIMTNTITCVKTPIAVKGIGIPVLTTNHIVYTSDYKDPRIATYGSTIVMLENVIERTQEQPSALVVSLIKQIIHIGTDLYTPCGIQIPAANLILSNKDVERLTKYVSAGDLIKVGASAKLAELINIIISIVHMLMYNPADGISKDMYSIRTRKIITYSNVIATSSNVLWVGGNVALGNKTAIKQLDIGGLLVMVQRLISDKEFIREIKKEFIFGSYRNMIMG
ncbi:MAG: hypothetical protein LUD84_03960 [Clostridiales bacterium]|nr:hypothetical protein [Clostridiales bacterium]